MIYPRTERGDEIGLDDRNVRQYEYTNSDGVRISIREDKPATYGDSGDGDQGPHFNAGRSGPPGTKLPQHHNWAPK